MRKYRNVKTGQVVSTYGEVSGTNWEEMLPEPAKDTAENAPKEPAAKTTAESPPASKSRTRKATK